MIVGDDHVYIFEEEIEDLRVRVQRAIGYGGLTTDKVTLVLNKQDCAMILACIHASMGTLDVDTPMPQ